MEWFNSLDTTLKIYWSIALITSLIFIIQAAMTFLGADASDGLDADFDGDAHAGGPFQLFSFRNLVNFFLGYGWATVCFYSTVSSILWLNVIAAIAGLLFVAIFFFLMLQITKLSQDNTFKLSDTLGKTADVYLAVPGGKKGKGKIQISVKGAYHEIAAMTEGEKIPTGAKAKVDSLIDGQTVLVSSLSNTIQ